MTLTFQQSIDEAIANTPTNGSDHEVAHSKPIMECEHRAQVMARLKKDLKHHQGPNRVHMGVAGFFNLQIAATTKPDYLLLLDYNTAQETFWHHVIDELKTAESLKDFKRYDCPPLTEEGFQHLKKLAHEGCIATATVDIINDRERAERLGNHLAEMELETDTAYWSNIGAYLMPGITESRRASNLISSTDSVHRDGTLQYPTKGFGGVQRGTSHWDGEETKHGKPVAFEELPPYERMLRNIAAIGGTKGTHIMTDLMEGYAPLIITDGPPSRTPKQWAKHEKAKRAYDAAVCEGKSVY